MKDLLARMKAMEAEMEQAGQNAEYWLEEEHFDEEKANRYEEEADLIYERLYQVFDQAAEMIVKITAGQITKITAMTMIRSRRAEVERIFT